MTAGAENTERTAQDWISLLKEGIVTPDANDEVLHSFIKHLANLGIFESRGGEMWALALRDVSSSVETIHEALLRNFDALRKGESGFILRYFLSRETSPNNDFPLPAMDKHFKESDGRPKKTSDLSVHHIVRKMGRQLSPFIEFEKNIVSRLEGGCVSRSDAKKLYKFMLSKMRDREKPRHWEQVSRRRHK